MACSRSEYDDKNLKKNAFSGRRLRLELDRLDNQKDHISKQFRHEKDQLRKQLAEGEGILKLKCLDPGDIRPLSQTDMKKLSPRFARKFSGEKLPSILPQIVHPPDTSKVSQPVRKDKQRRFSLPAPTIVLQECPTDDDNHKSRSNAGENASKLLQRRASANNALQRDSDDITGRINDFFQKIKNTNDNVGNSERETNKVENSESDGRSSTETQDTLR